MMDCFHFFEKLSFRFVNDVKNEKRLFLKNIIFQIKKRRTLLCVLAPRFVIFFIFTIVNDR